MLHEDAHQNDICIDVVLILWARGLRLLRCAHTKNLTFLMCMFIYMSEQNQPQEGC